MATRTRQEYLKDLAKNYITATTVETGQKFCKYILRNKKKKIIKSIRKQIRI